MKKSNRIRGGRKRMRIAEYRAMLRTHAQGLDPTEGAMERGMFDGYKCGRPQRSRRKRGHVRPWWWPPIPESENKKMRAVEDGIKHRKHLWDHYRIPRYGHIGFSGAMF